MTRITSIVLVLVLAASVAVVPLAVADLGTADVRGTTEDASDAAGDPDTVEPESDAEGGTDEREELAPGEQLAGAVGVQQAELDGEVSERAYGIKVASAQTDTDRADVATEQVRHVEDRLDELESKREQLEAAHEAGEISTGEYRAKMAITVADQRITERLATDAAVTVEQLDEDLLAERNVDPDEVRASADRAATTADFDVGDLVRSVVGERAGQPFAAEPFEPWSVDSEDLETDAKTATGIDVGNATALDGDGDLEAYLENETDVDADELIDSDGDTLSEMDIDDLIDGDGDELTDVDGDELEAIDGENEIDSDGTNESDSS